MRDDFLPKTKDVLFKRARGKCSNPNCRKETSMAHSDENRAVNLGEAAHITAASSGGYRYDPALPAQDRKSAHNGIWLCGTCAKLIDSDEPKYTVELLREWKIIAEAGDERESAKVATFSKMEKMMPELLKEMRNDLKEYPLRREFILMSKRWSYGMVGGYQPLRYYYEEHDNLDDKITILCNHNLAIKIWDNSNVKRYHFTEDLVDYLTQTC